MLSGYSVVDLGMIAAVDVNNHGQVVGQQRFANGDRAALWQNGVTTDLGALGFVGSFSQATAVADSGLVVGHSAVRAGSADRHGFLVTPEDTNGDGSPDRWFRDGNGDGLNDLMTDLGTGGRSQSYAHGVNRHGLVVGMTLGLPSPGGSGFTRAFLWHDGAMTDLGTFGGAQGFAYDINDAGQVIGYTQSRPATGASRS